MNDIKPKENTVVNGLVYATAIATIKRCDIKKKNRNRITNKYSAWNKKFREKLKLLEVNYQYWKNCQEGQM